MKVKVCVVVQYPFQIASRQLVMLSVMQQQLSIGNYCVCLFSHNHIILRTSSQAGGCGWGDGWSAHKWQFQLGPQVTQRGEVRGRSL